MRKMNGIIFLKGNALANAPLLLTHIHEVDHVPFSHWTMPFLHKAMENNPIKIHLSIMQFLRLNERMDVCLYMCNVNILWLHCSVVVLSICLCVCVLCIHMRRLQMKQWDEANKWTTFTYYMIRFCVLWYIDIDWEGWQIFIVLGYFKICSRKIVSRHSVPSFVRSLVGWFICLVARAFHVSCWHGVKSRHIV